MKKQDKITLKELLSRGYTPAQAARAIGRSGGHVRQVLSGARQSLTLVKQLKELPRRDLRLRRPLTSKTPQA